MAEAKLYEVHTVRGMIYAIHDVERGAFWTERTEDAARQFARERHLIITREQSISHEELLQILGHKPTPAPRVPTSAANVEIEIAESVDDQPSSANNNPFAELAIPRVAFPVRYHLQDESEDDVDIIARQTRKAPDSPFHIGDEIAPDSPADPT